MAQNREHFSGRAAVIMALAGSAIGLGNIWRFPYMVGEYGGAAFILIYLAATLLFSLPIFVAESVIGRNSHSNCIGAMKKLAPGTGWKVLGFLSVFTPLVIASYYAVVGGWSVGFLGKSLALGFLKPSEGFFAEFVAGPWQPLICFLLFLGTATVIVALGVLKGIERFSKYAIPVLFLIIVLLIIYSVSLPGAKEGVYYMIRPDFSKITSKTFVYALGQSFYSLSLGMGIIITYSSYVRKDENLMASAAGTAISDILFAFMAGMAIMPAVFSAGMKPDAGAGLVFQTLPYIFSQMAQSSPVLGSAVAGLFFLAILIAALTSQVSVMEVGVAWLTEEKKIPRGLAALLIFLVCAVFGSLCSLSFGPLSGFRIFGGSIFDLFDRFSSNFLLLAGGVLCVLFVGWKMPREVVYDEFTNGGTLSFNAKIFGILYFLIKWVAPVAVAVIFISNFI